MVDPVPLGQQMRVEAFGSKHRTGLVTLLFTDMVGSTALKQQLGDRLAADLFRKHHGVIREALRQFPEGEEIETAGDSFLLIFATPSDAVKFALLLHASLRRLQGPNDSSALERIGIHVGEVLLGSDVNVCKPRNLFGIQVDTCARVMSLATAGQTLMTRSVFDSARQVLKGEDVPGIGSLEWLNHGPYLLKGLEEPLEICEVREAGTLTDGPPTNSEKAQRQVTSGDEPVLGWRPAVVQTVPNTRWVLEKKLGEGGFGEVWLGRHQHTKERRVFKFCFQAERVRFLKRETTLFRLLRDRVGEHPNIARLNDIYLDQPPFYIEMDYVEGSDLRTWCEERGGIQAVPLEKRLEIVAQAADGLQAAHEAGIIHRDIKPANILIGSKGTAEASLQVKLTDFGIGQVVSAEYLEGITRAGFTQTIEAGSSSSRTGTQLYMAPELLSGKPASIRSDVYSLGVVLYQLLVGSFSQPVTTDWKKSISDPLLLEDLEQCFIGDPQERLPSIELLARSLRTLPQRRESLLKEEAEIAARERASYRRGILRTAGVAAAILALIASLAVVAMIQSKRATAAALAEKQQRARAEANEYIAKMALVQHAWERNDAQRMRRLLDETAVFSDRSFEWKFWQHQLHKRVKTLRGHKSGVNSVAFAPNGKRIVTGCRDGTAKVWESETGKELLTLKGHSFEIFSVAFSSDGERIVTASRDTTAKVWDASVGTEVHALKGHEGRVFAAAFGPDGQRIVTGGQDKTARVWDASNGDEVRAIKAHSAWINSVAFSPDGKRFVTGSKDMTAKVWHLMTGEEVLTLRGHKDEVKSVCYSPDGRRIVTGSTDHTLKVWDAESGEELLNLEGHGGDITPVAFSPDGARIITGGRGRIETMDAVSGQGLMTLKGYNKGDVYSVAVSPDGQRIVAGGSDRAVEVWEPASRLPSISLKGHTKGLTCAAFSPDGQWVITGSFDRAAKVWEASSGKEVFALEGHSSNVWVAVFSPDGRRILTGGNDHAFKVWDSASHKLLLTLKSPNGAAAYSPDGRRIITGGFDKRSRVWDASNGKELLALGESEGFLQSVTFSPDGRRIITCGCDPTAEVWDAVKGKELLILHHDDAIWSAGYSQDGRRIVTGAEDKTAKVWDAASGEHLLTLNGHGRLITSVAFSPDGKRILTGSGDETAKVWDSATGKELLTLEGHRDLIYSVAFSPDGERIVTASMDQTAIIWQAATGLQLAAWQEEEKGRRPE